MRTGLALEFGREFGNNKLVGSNVLSQSGLEDDMSTNDNNFKVEIEVELSELTGALKEIEVEITFAKELSNHIALDNEYLEKEVYSKELIDYSNKAFNSKIEGKDLDPITMVGNESVMGTIADGFKYAINNKLEVLKKVWEKIVFLFNILVKKMKDFYGKILIAIKKMNNYPKQILEMISVLPRHDKVNISLLTDETKEDLLLAFSIFAITAGNKTFSFGDTQDLRDFSEFFSRDIFPKLNLDSISHEDLESNKAFDVSIIDDRDIKVLNELKKKEILNKNFDSKRPFDKAMPIIFIADKLTMLTDISTDSVKNSFALTTATVKSEVLKDIVIDLGVYDDLNSMLLVLQKYLREEYEAGAREQILTLGKIGDKINEYNKKVAEETNATRLEQVLNTYTGGYNVLKLVLDTNLTSALDCYTRCINALAAVAKDSLANEQVQKEKQNFPNLGAWYAIRD